MVKKQFIFCCTAALLGYFSLHSVQGQINVASSSADEEKAFGIFLDSLTQAGIPDYGKANAIRQYLSGRLVRGKAKNETSEQFAVMPYDSLPLFECLSLYRAGGLSGNCGLSSFVLAKLLHHAGYKTYVYDCGFANTRFTHQFTLVVLDEKVVVQDAHYNITFTDKEGEPKDFLQMLAEINSGNFTGFNVVQGEIIKSGSKTNFESIAKDRLRDMLPSLKSAGLPASFYSIYLLPLYVMDVNGNTAGDLKEKILSVTGKR